MRANGRASGPVLTSRFLAVLNHCALGRIGDGRKFFFQRILEDGNSGGVEALIRFDGDDDEAVSAVVVVFGFDWTGMLTIKRGAS